MSATLLPLLPTSGSAPAGIPESKETRISLHPDLHEAFKRLGGAGWVRQALLPHALAAMSEDKRVVVQTRMYCRASFAEAVLAYETTPDAVVLTDGRCVSRAYAQTSGIPVITLATMPDLPQTSELRISNADLSPGRPRSDQVAPPPAVDHKARVEQMQEQAAREKKHDEDWKVFSKWINIYQNFEKRTRPLDDPFWQLSEVERKTIDINDRIASLRPDGSAI